MDFSTFTDEILNEKLQFLYSVFGQKMYPRDLNLNAVSIQVYLRVSLKSR